MASWDSYGYPENDPKVWITFGPQKDGPPQVAFLGPIRQPEGDSTKAVEYYPVSYTHLTLPTILLV